MGTTKFEDDYGNLKAKMADIGFIVNKGTLSKFSKNVNGVEIHVAAYIPSQKPLFKIGQNYSTEDVTYIDEIFQYEVWAEKNGKTLASMSCGGKGMLDITGISKAANEMCSQFEN